MLPRRILLSQAGLGVAAIVINAVFTTLPAAAKNRNGNSDDPKSRHRRERRHDRGARRCSDSTVMVPL